MAKWGKPAGMPATSSVTMQWAAMQTPGPNRTSLTPGIVVTMARGLTLRAKHPIGFSSNSPRPGDTVGASPFYTLSGSRRALVASGATFMLAYLARVLGGQLPAGQHQARKARSFNWHFVGAVWIALLSVLYVVG